MSATGTVLLIAGDTTDIASLKVALAQAGVEIRHVTDVPAALSTVSDHGFDAVLVGDEQGTSAALAFLKGSPARVPVIVLSDPGDGCKLGEVIKYKLSGALTYAGRVQGDTGEAIRAVTARISQGRSGRIGSGLREEIGKVAYFADGLPEPGLLIDRLGNIVYTNQAFDSKYGYRQGDLAGREISAILAGRDDLARLRDLMRIGSPGGSFTELATVTRGKQSILSMATLSSRRDQEGSVFAHFLQLRDITDSRSEETELHRRLSVLTNPEVGLSGFDFSSVIQSPEIQELQDTMAAAFGVATVIVSPDGVPLNRGSNSTPLCAGIAGSGTPAADDCKTCIARLARRTTAEAGARCYCALTGLVEAAVPMVVNGQLLACWIVGQVALGKIDGQKLDQVLRAALVPPDKVTSLLIGVPRMTEYQFNQIVAAFSTVSDKVTKLAAQNLQQGKHIHERNLLLEELKRSEQRLKDMSYRDGLTGLYNRAFFELEVGRLAREDTGTPVSIVEADVDGLKLINDTLGHAAGDQLIIATGRLLARVFSGTGTVYRIGGDEFCALLPGCDGPAACQELDRLTEAIGEHNSDSSDPPVRMSVGMATATTGAGIHEAYKQADNRMYENKMNRGGLARSKSLDTILVALSERDYLDQGHTRALAVIVDAMARALGLGEDVRANLKLLARLHDLGKIGVPDSILLKPGPLDEREWIVMRSHVETGANIASRSAIANPIAPLILHHHERYDGKGYPSGLAGDRIPLECRILAIADTFDAMIADRPYRKGLSRDAALEEIRRCAGTQFDPGLVEVFLSLAGSCQI